MSICVNVNVVVVCLGGTFETIDSTYKLKGCTNITLFLELTFNMNSKSSSHLRLPAEDFIASQLALRCQPVSGVYTAVETQQLCVYPVRQHLRHSGTIAAARPTHAWQRLSDNPSTVYSCWRIVSQPEQGLSLPHCCGITRSLSSLFNGCYTTILSTANRRGCENYTIRIKPPLN